MSLIPTKESVIGQYINGRNAAFDFLQLADNHGGTVFGWIDALGHLQGSLKEGLGTGNIIGTIAANQVAVGTGADTIGGSSALTFASNTLTIGDSNQFIETIPIAGALLIQTNNGSGDGQIILGSGLSVGFSVTRVAGIYSTVINASAIGGQFNFNSGTIAIAGTTSGSATIGVAAIAGNPTPINLPITSGTVGQVLTTDGANPQQTSWTTAVTTWNQIQSATADLTLANTSFNTTFNQTTPALWTWANITAATNVTNQSSPILSFKGTYWDGAASQVDTFKFQNIVQAGTNPGTVLQFSHTGSPSGGTFSFIGPVNISAALGTGTITLTPGSPIVFQGAVSGTSTQLGAASAAGTPNRINLPTTTGTNGQVLTTDGANPQQTSWTTVGTTTTIASGTATLGTTLIASGAKATLVTVSAPGTLTTDTIMADFNADPTSTTGYTPSANGMLTIVKYPTSGNVNFYVINNTGASITPGSVVLNFRVVR